MHNAVSIGPNNEIPVSNYIMLQSNNAEPEDNKAKANGTTSSCPATGHELLSAIATKFDLI